MRSSPQTILLCPCRTNTGTIEGGGGKKKTDEEEMTTFGSGVMPGQILVKTPT